MTRSAFVAVLCLLASQAFGQGWGDGSPRAEALPEEPDRIVARGVDRLAGFLSGPAEPSQRDVVAFLEREIAPHFDFAYMARWAAGPLHRRLDDDERARFATKLRALFLSALARNLGSYARPAPRVDVYPPRRATGSREATVRAQVNVGGSPPMRLDFRFYWDGAAWRIFDVAANRASAVAYYRSYFGSLLRREGPDALFE